MVDLYQWLLDNTFVNIDTVKYEEYIVITVCVITILLISLVAKAFCYAFSIFFR